MSRRTVVTWYTPEEKMPSDGCAVAVFFTGKIRNRLYEQALGCAVHGPEGWMIDGLRTEECGPSVCIDSWADIAAPKEM